jgi:GcrA cell cycle regulator
MTPAARKLAELPLAHCLWGIGDPAEDDFRFCGQRAERGHPYCADHAELAIERRDEAKAA